MMPDNEAEIIEAARTAYHKALGFTHPEYRGPAVEDEAFAALVAAILAASPIERLQGLLAQAYRVDEPDTLFRALVENEDAAWRRSDADRAEVERLQARVAELEAWAKAHEVPHYGEPEGLTNCEANPFSYPLTTSEIANGGGEEYPRGACTCGADEANAVLRALLGDGVAS